jgi:hypothetical protein
VGQVEQFAVKNDLFGLGFDPLDNTPGFAEMLHSATGHGRPAEAQGRVMLKGSGAGAGAGGAFGLVRPRVATRAVGQAGADTRGAQGMDEADEGDDVDTRAGTADYDVEIGGDEDDEEAMMEAMRQPRAKPKKPAAAAPAAGAAVCHDGRAPLKPFVLAAEPAAPPKRYPPPPVPDDFVAFHRFADALPTPVTDWKAHRPARAPPARRPPARRLPARRAGPAAPEPPPC